MAAKKTEPKPEESYATEAEIVEAIRRLTTADLERLRREADLRARALAAVGLGISGRDLVQEALKRTLAGKRRWVKSIKFVQHLLGAVKSISSSAPKKVKGVVLVEADPQGGDSDQPLGPQLASPLADPERLAMVQEETERIEGLATGDERALLVIEGLKEGMTGPDIQAWLKISQTEYETIMRRLRRRARGKE